MKDQLTAFHRLLVGADVEEVGLEVPDITRQIFSESVQVLELVGVFGIADSRVHHQAFVQ